MVVGRKQLDHIYSQTGRNNMIKTIHAEMREGCFSKVSNNCNKVPSGWLKCLILFSPAYMNARSSCSYTL